MNKLGEENNINIQKGSALKRKQILVKMQGVQSKPGGGGKLWLIIQGGRTHEGKKRQVKQTGKQKC